MKEKAIKLYNPDRFTTAHMPSDELHALLKGDTNKFLVIRVEDMYRHVRRPVPASRATTHTCLFLAEGTATMKIGSEQYTIQQDEALLVPAGQVFSFSETDVNKGYLCSFHEDVLIGKFGKSEALKDFDFLRLWGDPLIRLKNGQPLFVANIFNRLLSEYEKRGSSNPEIIQPYLITLLCELNEAYRSQSINQHKTAAVKITKAFKELIFSNITSIHHVTDYAALLNITPNHLNKTVKAVTGRSAARLINEAIVLEAKVLLSQTSFTISGVAAAVGFTDQSYFTRLFRKLEGSTPSEFRKMIEKS